jgi:DNA-binding winged helix-turn-helix (wHTH) protein/tetratricopeptide (TPR) repeat protein
MIHRFPTFEIDEPLRELRAGGESIALQPRVFDLLVYLVKNSDRVVPKDELLDVVWSDVVVADGSLQRAVSLLRSTLEKLGAPDVIRTYARKGYRFCADESPVQSSTWDPVAAAKRTQEDIERMTPAELQEWTQNAQCHGRNEAAIAPLEQAVAVFTSSGQTRRAAWIATLLAQVRMEWRDFAVCSGWYHRAQRLLEGQEIGIEHGYLSFLGSRLAIFQNDLEGSKTLGEQTWEIGVKLGDRDLQNLGLLALGEARVFLGEVREGLAALDEAGVAVAADGLSSWVGALVYCGVIYTCMTRSDWQRAGEWTEQFSRWGAGRGLTSYPGLCRMHRAEVLTVKGRLREAEEELRLSLQTLAVSSPWTEGEVWRVQGETCLAKGDLAGARAALEKAMENGWEVQYELAVIMLAEGDAAGAADAIGRAIRENAYSCRSRRGRALCSLAVAASRAGRLKEAREALSEVERLPELIATPALQNHVVIARAELAAAEGRRREAIGLMREAVRNWMFMEAPLAAGEVRCRLAEWLSAEGEAEFARLELKAAEALFDEAGADLQVKNVRARLKSV